MRALGRLARDADGPGVLGAAADRLLKPFGVPAGTHEALAEADVYIVTRLSVPENRELAIRLVLPFGVLSDPSGETTDLFVRGGDAHSLGLTTCTLDANLRVLRSIEAAMARPT